MVTPAACAYAIFGHGSDNPFYVAFPTAYAAGVAIFVAMTSFAKVRWRPLASIGLVSYSLYLLHLPVIYAMRFAFSHGAPGAAWPFGIQILLAAALSIALAGLAFQMVERPGIDLGHRLSRAPRLVGAASVR